MGLLFGFVVLGAVAFGGGVVGGVAPGELGFVDPGELFPGAVPGVVEPCPCPCVLPAPGWPLCPDCPAEPAPGEAEDPEPPDGGAPPGELCATTQVAQPKTSDSKVILLIDMKRASGLLNSVGAS